MSYDRCQDHGLLRCAVCAPRAEGRGSIVLPKPIQAPTGWSPEDALDSSLGVPRAVSVNQPDKQALEAMERQKPAAVEVDFGDDEPVVVPQDPITEAIKKAIFPIEPPFQIEKTSSDPVVAAAQAYAHAVTAVKMAEERFSEAEEEVKAANAWLQEKYADRDAKKLALKTQVE